MRLNLNSPAYYSKEIGVDNEIHSMCQEISRYMRDKEYSEIVDTIGIVPIVAPKELIDAGKWKKERKYDLKYRLVFVSKQISFDDYVNANIQRKKELILENIIDSVKSIHKKSKFDFEQFKIDLMNFIESNELM